MVVWARTLSRLLAIPACLGMVAGLVVAGQEISASDYLAQGLWRTALWTAGDASLVGAMWGAGAGLFMVGWLIRRRPAADDAGVEGRHGLVMVLSAALAIALTVVPADSPELLGLSAVPIFRGGLFLLWALLSVPLLRRAGDPSRAGEVPDGAWTAVVWLGFGAGLSQLWARLTPGVVMVAAACTGLLAALGVYAALRRPVLSLSAGVGRRLQGAAARRIYRGAAVVLSLGAALWVADEVVAWQARAQAGRAHRNLLIIAVDTLREDRVSLLSKPTSGWDLTPSLRAHLSRRGTYFRRAYAQAPWTMPSFASILTGLYPEAHGADRGDGGLAPARLTLAEVLREHGYETMAVISGEFATSDVGMLQGFDIADESHVSDLHDVTSAAVTDRALSLLSQHGKEPFFLFAHYFDPHFGYERHPEFHLSAGEPRDLVPQATKKLEAGAFFPSDRNLRELKARYAEEIAYTDRQIGRLLDFLDARHLWDSTCVVFVADHGEEFAEHGGFEHGDTLYEELVHVPLLVVDPSRPTPAVSDDIVETRSLFGTALHMLGLHPPASRSAAPTLFAPRGAGEAYARSSARNIGSCLVGRQYKLIKGADLGAPAGQKSPPARAMLFDLRRDPGESTDLSEARPDIAARFRTALEAKERDLRPRGATAPAPKPSEQHLRKLRDLGYL